MKKIISLLLILSILSFSAVAYAYTTIEIYINGVRYEPDVKPFIDASNRTIVPIRLIAEGLGCKVDWNEKQQLVTISKGDKVVKLTINKREALVNGKTVEMDTQAVIKDGKRTMVPLRFVSENMDCTVDFKIEYTTPTIYIKSNDPNLLSVEHIGFSAFSDNDPTTNGVKYSLGFNVWKQEQVDEAKKLLEKFVKDKDALNQIYTHIEKKSKDVSFYEAFETYTFCINGKNYRTKMYITGGNPIISFKAFIK
ncbi:copper amine oxidase N-terminal domain-containing protein [Thermovenabulum gondwanense]|uniref:Copper amine oxidase-like N-terminal domain-containing protein n=1 Tax=Thermovenabulum gondwanense TaxID=520767 RepID=A0A162MVW4_9FIRM|nr:copper amine oxidase N-terminal domain-containing protein [Thermovenabulum gondwanense]KYO67972.1 hypothetical protein ATZ99_02810 [Thermovenabulum gondwanense]